MQNLNSIDMTIIVTYIIILMGLGFYLKNKASNSLEDYLIDARHETRDSRRETEDTSH